MRHVQENEEGDYEMKHVCYVVLQAIHDGGVDPKLTFFTVEAWFCLNGYINVQNNRYLSSINLTQTLEVRRLVDGVPLLLYEQKD
jgi:hypothetical protein